MMHQVIEKEIMYVEAFLMDEYSVYVDFDVNGLDEYWFDPTNPEDTGVVSISTSNTPLMQLVVLLHEAGHIIFRQKNNKNGHENDRKTLLGRMDIMHEEMMAWHEGRLLSRQLGIEIEKEMWEESYCDSLLKYIKWVLDETEEN